MLTPSPLELSPTFDAFISAPHTLTGGGFCGGNYLPVYILPLLHLCPFPKIEEWNSLCTLPPALPQGIIAYYESIDAVRDDAAQIDGEIFAPISIIPFGSN